MKKFKLYGDIINFRGELEKTHIVEVFKDVLKCREYLRDNNDWIVKEKGYKDHRKVLLKVTFVEEL